MFSPDDTIVALATPAGRGGLAVVRLSGPRSREIAARLFDSPAALEPRRATLVRLAAPAASPPAARAAIDEALVTWFAAPASYTGEDVVEISVHGSPVVAAEVVAACAACGARAAGPGEFTLRAFLHGRIDLTRAEAVGDLVAATTPTQASLDLDQLQGGLAERIGEIERGLFALIATLEASVDFGEDEQAFVSPEEVRAALADAVTRIDALLATARRGRLVREGAVVAIVGRPNVGKSTLFNRLVGADRAIVTPVPGTTRDVIVEAAQLGAATVTLVDTAGVRKTADPVEREGVARAEKASAAADVAVVVLDRSAALTEDDRALLAAAANGSPRVVVANKSDLPAAWEPGDLAVASGPGGALDVVEASALTGSGTDELIRAIDKALSVTGDIEAVIISNVRHIDLLGRSAEVLRGVAGGDGGRAGSVPDEILLSDLKWAVDLLQEVTGERTTDDLLNEIFSRFCVGK